VSVPEEELFAPPPAADTLNVVEDNTRTDPRCAVPSKTGINQHVRGAQRMKARGRKRVELWLDDNELSQIAAAAGSTPLATWIRKKAFHAAGEVLADRRRRRTIAEREDLEDLAGG
jgi:hypothetical protein